MRHIVPPADKWLLTGGAYLDGEQIVLASYGSAAQTYIPVFGALSFSYKNANVWTDPTWTERRILRSFQYYALDKKTPVYSDSGYKSNGNASTANPSGWGSTASFGADFKDPNNRIGWLSVTVSISLLYGSPGTKFIPSQDDLTLSYL